MRSLKFPDFIVKEIRKDKTSELSDISLQLPKF
jgi:hypothetical protein